MENSVDILPPDVEKSRPNFHKHNCLINKDFQKETWKNVRGYAGVYEVSNLGRVRSLDCVSIGKDLRVIKRRGRVLIPGRVKSDYLGVTLKFEGKKWSVGVHRLVAEAFLPSFQANLQVNHINHDIRDNRAVNLEMVTAQGNADHSAKHGRKAQKIKAIDVYWMRRLYETGKHTHKALGLRFGVTKQTVKKICARQIWAHVH